MTSVRVGDIDVELLTLGDGDVPVLYLHGFADVHGLLVEPTDFHHELARGTRLLVPAHPGCAASGGLSTIDGVDDLSFHYLRLLDGLDLERVAIVGTCIGGWIGADLAARNPERVESLTLIASAGMLVPGTPTADLFMLSQARDWGNLSDFRELLFAEPHGDLATSIVPDGKASDVAESMRFRALSFAARVGWRPPYLYDPKLERHLDRVRCQTLVVWGGLDRLIPVAHAQAFAAAIPNATVHTIAEAGHAVHLEHPTACAQAVADHLAGHLARGQ
jgi:pimeloyl-ACP methyl ester carboxylesterase